MKIKLLALFLAIGLTSQQKIESITEEQLQKMIANGEVEVVKSASGGQIYQTETSSVSGGQYGGEVYYSKPVIAQTLESATRTVVDQTIDKQPIITRKVVSQPIIKQRII